MGESVARIVSSYALDILLSNLNLHLIGINLDFIVFIETAPCRQSNHVWVVHVSNLLELTCLQLDAMNDYLT